MHHANNDDGKSYARRTAFAIASQLKPKLDKQSITPDDLWAYIKVDFGVDSRSELSELDWVKVAARLHSAQRHKILFDELCEKIKTHKLYKDLSDAESEAA